MQLEIINTCLLGIVVLCALGNYYYAHGHQLVRAIRHRASDLIWLLPIKLDRKFPTLVPPDSWFGGKLYEKGWNIADRELFGD